MLMLLLMYIYIQLVIINNNQIIIKSLLIIPLKVEVINLKNVSYKLIIINNSHPSSINVID